MTVVVPCYNAAAFLADTLRSFDEQTLGGFEVLFVDDGSTDGTLGMVTDYARERPGTRVLHRPDNRGVCRTLNEGVAAVSTEFTVVFAADDVMLPNLMADALAAIDRSSERCAAVAFAHYAGTAEAEIRSGPDGSPEVRRPPAGADGLEPPGLLPLQLVANHLAGVALFRTDVLRGLGYDERSHIEDWDMWCRIVAAHPIAVADEPVFIYRDSPMSLDKRLKQSGQRSVAGAAVRAKFCGDGGPIDDAILRRTKMELHVLIAAGLRREARTVMRLLAEGGLRARFPVERAVMAVPTPVVRCLARLAQRARRLRSR